MYNNYVNNARNTEIRKLYTNYSARGMFHAGKNSKAFAQSNYKTERDYEVSKQVYVYCVIVLVILIKAHH